MRANRYDRLLGSGLILLVLLFLWPALLPGRVLLPLDIVTEIWAPWQAPDQLGEINNWHLVDAISYIYPAKEFAASSIRQGILPLWNPYEFAGYPFTYNSQAGMFYPLMAFYYLLPATTAVDLTIISQMILGSLFMYAYLRRIRLRPLSAAAGAIIFTFNGLMVVWLEWQAVHASIIWLPAILYAVERIRAAPDGRGVAKWGLAAGISLALPWLGGHWNWALYTSLTAIAYLTWRLAPILGAENGRWRRWLAGASLMLLFSLGLSLVQVLPAVVYLAQTTRGPLPWSSLVREGLLPRLATLVVPNFFGSPLDGSLCCFEGYPETTIYLGLLPLLLAALLPWLRRDRLAWFFTGWGGLGLLWTLGTPAYGLLYLLPVFDGLMPKRASMIVMLAVAVLAAMALDRLLDDGPSPRFPTWILPSAAGLLVALPIVYLVYYWTRLDLKYLQRPLALAAVWLFTGLALLLARRSGRLSGQRFGGLALAIILADLWHFGYGYNTISPVSQLFPATATTDFLRAEDEKFRILTVAHGVAYHPNTALALRLENFTGYEPGILRRVVALANEMELGHLQPMERLLNLLLAIDSPLLDMLNVRYVVSTADLWHINSIPAISDRSIGAWRPLVSTRRAFDAGRPGLHGIELPLRATPAAEGQVTVHILSPAGVVLAEASQPVAALRWPDWTPFYFQVIGSEQPPQFILVATYDGTGEVRIGMSMNRAAEPAFAAYALAQPRVVHEASGTRIYYNDGAFPRAWVAKEALWVEGEAEALAAVVAQQGRLGELVVLELVGKPPLSSSPGGSSGASSMVRIVSYGLNQVTLAAEMAEPGFVVLADGYYPGWRATVDGVETAVYRANYLLRAVYVPAGQHTIQFTFRPLDFQIGATVSVLSLLAAGLTFFWSRRRPRGRKRVEGA